MKRIILDQPLVEGTSFTLLNILPSPNDNYPTSSALPKVKLPQARRSIEIDQDVVDKLRQQFGNMPLGRAIRIMVGLKPKKSQNAWQEEEDELLWKYYPDYGSKNLAEVLGRKPPCIRNRASKLGIRRVWEYKWDRRRRNRGTNAK